jgi:hypothetical protein
MERYVCPPCGHTVSVLLANRLPYRSLEVERLQGALDARAEVGTGLDRPTESIEAGCLQRVWSRFLTPTIPTPEQPKALPMPSERRLRYSEANDSGHRSPSAESRTQKTRSTGLNLGRLVFRLKTRRWCRSAAFSSSKWRRDLIRAMAGRSHKFNKSSMPARWRESGRNRGFNGRI